MYYNPYPSCYYLDPHPASYENLSTHNNIILTPEVVIPSAKEYELELYCQSICDDTQRLISVHRIYANISSCNSKILTKYLYHKLQIFDNAQCYEDLYKIIQNNSAKIIRFFPEFVRLASIMLQEYSYYNLVYSPFFQNYWKDKDTVIDVFNALKTISSNLFSKERADDTRFLFDIIFNIGVILLKLFLKHDTEKIGKELIENICDKEYDEINLKLVSQKIAELIVLEKPSFAEQQNSVGNKHLKNRIKLKDVLILIYMMTMFQNQTKVEDG